MFCLFIVGFGLLTDVLATRILDWVAPDLSCFIDVGVPAMLSIPLFTAKSGSLCRVLSSSVGSIIKNMASPFPSLKPLLPPDMNVTELSNDMHFSTHLYSNAPCSSRFISADWQILACHALIRIAGDGVDNVNINSDWSLWHPFSQIYTCDSITYCVAWRPDISVLLQYNFFMLHNFIHWQYQIILVNFAAFIILQCMGLS